MLVWVSVCESVSECNNGTHTTGNRSGTLSAIDSNAEHNAERTEGTAVVPNNLVNNGMWGFGFGTILIAFVSVASKFSKMPPNVWMEWERYTQMRCVEFWWMVARQIMGLRNSVYLYVNRRVRLQRARWFTQIYIELHSRRLANDHSPEIHTCGWYGTYARDAFIYTFAANNRLV